MEHGQMVTQEHLGPDDVTTGRVNLTDNAITILERRYLQRDEDGALTESPEQMFIRVSESVAAVEPSERLSQKWSQRFYEEMAALRFLPNSPTLMNAGSGDGTLAACFVLPVEDSLESIISTAKAAAMVQKYGGGTGFSLSRLRGTSKTFVPNRGVSYGPVSVVKHYDDVSRLVTQAGRREGANMGVLRVDHPDIRKFIHSKDDGSAQRFNISVAITDTFMESVHSGVPYTLRDPKSGQPAGNEDARAILDEIASSAWRTGDPGLLFLDEINRHNPTPDLGEIEATNPCGEVPLLPWEACTLGSINVAQFWITSDGELNWEGLRNTIDVGVRFLDNAVEASIFPLNEIQKAVHGNRKIGLGIMGFADLLIAAGIPYDSKPALDLAERLGRELSNAADDASRKLGEEKGTFPNWNSSIYATQDTNSAGVERFRYRNATRTCIAPTGTISIIAGASSGIEPLFSLAHHRRLGDGSLLPEVSAPFEQAARNGGFYSQALIERLATGERLEDQNEVPLEIQRRFATAHEIAPEWHVRMQAAFQSHTDLAVSKTVNLPQDATTDQILSVFLLAHDLGCKGVTIYRDGSRSMQVLEHAPVRSQTVPSTVEVSTNSAF